jgi:hypothetical protein
MGASVVVKRKGETIAVVLPGGKKPKLAEAEAAVEEEGDNDSDGDSGGGLAGLLGGGCKAVESSWPI